MGAFNHGELTVICTNLRKACEKQLRSEEAALFGKLATYFSGKTECPGQATLQEIGAVIDEELATLYPQANEQAEAAGDRGAKRALLWGEKVTRLHKSFLIRLERNPKLLDETPVWVCESCGFLFVGAVSPAICPICKVPNIKIHKMEVR